MNFSLIIYPNDFDIEVCQKRPFNLDFPVSIRQHKDSPPMIIPGYERRKLTNLTHRNQLVAQLNRTHCFLNVVMDIELLFQLDLFTQLAELVLCQINQ